MIEYSQFCHQLQTDVLSLLRQWPLCVGINLLQENILQLVILHTDIPNCELRIRITYNAVYQEPFLIFQIWRTELLQDDIEEERIWFPSDLSRVLNTARFSIGLDYIDPQNKQVWYSLHPCDTAEILGTKHVEAYLLRWCSVYFTAFQHDFSSLFVGKCTERRKS